MKVNASELARINVFRGHLSLQENQLFSALRDLIARQAEGRRLLLVFVGTPLNTGDCLGPLAGTFLERGLQPWREFGLGVEVRGTLGDPVHARNLGARAPELAPPGTFVLAVDAAVGTAGEMVLVHAPLQPGVGMGRWLPQVGDAHLLCAVSPHPSGFLSAHMGEVLNMAELVSRSLLRAILAAREGRSDG